MNLGNIVIIQNSLELSVDHNILCSSNSDVHFKACRNICMEIDLTARNFSEGFKVHVREVTTFFMEGAPIFSNKIKTPTFFSFDIVKQTHFLFALKKGVYLILATSVVSWRNLASV